MTEIVYCSYQINREKKVGFHDEWVLFIGEKSNNFDGKTNLFVPGSGFLIRFFLGNGCLGTKRWNYVIHGNPYHRNIDLFFLKQAGNYMFMRILEDFTDKVKDWSLEDFDSFVSIRYNYVKKIDKPLGKWDNEFFTKGLFGEVTVCG